MLQIRAYRLFNLIPLGGIGLFIVLYIVAALMYPGGSNANMHDQGFSILNNYWCDLLDYWSKNGAYNTSRPFAMTAMVLLCSSLAVFWYYLPRFIVSDPDLKKVIQFAGVSAMVSAIFVFTKYHDFVVNLAGVFGAIAILATFIGLLKSKRYTLSVLGILCFSLCSINYYIFQTKQYIEILPIIQKFTFLICLFWFGLIDVQIHDTKKTM